MRSWTTWLLAAQAASLVQQFDSFTGGFDQPVDPSSDVVLSLKSIPAIMAATLFAEVAELADAHV